MCASNLGKRGVAVWFAVTTTSIRWIILCVADISYKPYVRLRPLTSCLSCDKAVTHLPGSSYLYGTTYRKDENAKVVWTARKMSRFTLMLWTLLSILQATLLAETSIFFFFLCVSFAVLLGVIDYSCCCSHVGWRSEHEKPLRPKRIRQE